MTPDELEAIEKRHRENQEAWANLHRGNTATYPQWILDTAALLVVARSYVERRHAWLNPTEPKVLRAIDRVLQREDLRCIRFQPALMAADLGPGRHVPLKRSAGGLAALDEEQG